MGEFCNFSRYSSRFTLFSHASQISVSLQCNKISLFQFFSNTLLMCVQFWIFFAVCKVYKYHKFCLKGKTTLQRKCLWTMKVISSLLFTLFLTCFSPTSSKPMQTKAENKDYCALGDDHTMCQFKVTVTMLCNESNVKDLLCECSILTLHRAPLLRARKGQRNQEWLRRQRMLFLPSTMIYEESKLARTKYTWSAD